MKTIHDRIQFIIADQGLTGNKFDVKCSFQKGYINDFIRNKRNISHAKLLTIIEQNERYTTQWIVTGKGPIYTTNQTSNLLQHRFTNIYKKFPAICITDANGKITFINDEYTKQTHYTFAEVKGKKPGDFLRKTDFPETTNIKLKKLFKSKDAFYERVFPNYTKLGLPVVCEIIVLPVIYQTKVECFISFCNFEKV